MKSKFGGKWIVVQVKVWKPNGTGNYVKLIAVFLLFYIP